MSRRLTLPRSAGGALSPLGVAAIAVQIALGLAFAGWLVWQQDPHLPGDGTWTIDAAFADADGLSGADHARVTVAGVDAGRVESVRLLDGRAVAHLRLDADVRGTLRAGARAQIQERSALNDLVVDITPGPRTAPALHPGAQIDAADTASYVPLDRVLQTLDADTRASVQVLVDELDRGIGSRRGGALAAALRRLDPVGADARRVTALLARRRALLTGLVGDLDVLGRALASRAGDLQRAIGATHRVLAVTAARDRQLGSTVRLLPATLADLRVALAAVRSLARPLEPALSRLGPTARSLPSALAALRRATPSARALVEAVGAAGSQGRAGAHALRRVLERLGPVSRSLTDAVRRTGPIVRAIDAHKQGIGQLGDRFSGVFSTNDQNGVILRGLGFFEPFNPADFGFSAPLTAAQRAKVAAEVVTALTRVCKRENPVACLVRYLVPGLPGAVRSASDPLGLARSLPRGDR